MSKGAVIFAYNSNFNYIDAATFAARQIKKHLKIPVTLITDQYIISDAFQVVKYVPKIDSSSRNYRDSNNDITTIEWHNKNRTSVYELSPYDQTLLIDADYFMFNDSLKHVFNTDVEMACFAEVNDLIEHHTQQATVGTSYGIPMQWATVVYFTKSQFSKSVFEFMEIIKQNWDYYSLLYGFRNHSYRNDFSLSIAIQALSGYSTTAFARLPGKLHTIFTHVEVNSVNGSEVILSIPGKRTKVKDMNLHVMNKEAMKVFYDT